MTKEEKIIRDFLLLKKFEIPNHCWDYSTKKSCYFYWEKRKTINRGLTYRLEKKCNLWDASLRYDHRVNVSPCVQCQEIKDLLKDSELFVPGDNSSGNVRQRRENETEFHTSNRKFKGPAK